VSDEIVPVQDQKPEKSFFSTSPMERHGDSDEGRKAAVREADRMLREYFEILHNADLDTYALARKIELCELGADNLNQKAQGLREDLVEIMQTYEARAQARLGQVRLYREEYIRAGRKDPPGTHKELPAGEVVFRKVPAPRAQWQADGDDLVKIVQRAVAQLPPKLAMALDVLKTTTTVSLSSLKDLLNERGDMLKVVDHDGGQVYEIPIGVEMQHPGGETTLEPLLHTPEDPNTYTVTARRREEKKDDE